MEILQRPGEDDILSTPVSCTEAMIMCVHFRIWDSYSARNSEYVYPRTGFISAVRSILKMKEGSLATIGVPCSSFIFLNSGTSRRSPELPLGREDLPYIDQANSTLGS